MKFNHLNFKAMKKTIVMMAALMLVPIVVYFGHSELLDPTALETVYEYTDAATGAVTQCAFGGGIFNASWQDIVSGLGWGLGYSGTDSRRAGIGARRAKIGAGEDGEERKPGESVGRGRPVIFRPKSFS